MSDIYVYYIFSANYILLNNIFMYQYSMNHVNYNMINEF